MRPLRHLVILLLVLVSIGLVVASPWALRALGGSNLDWSRLSNIGQTYGAVSAIIAAVALLGVVSSLIVQSREAKIARISAQRAHHVELSMSGDLLPNSQAAGGASATRPDPCAS